MTLQVSSNRRFLIQDDKETPFFYLGDTAWELFHRLSRDEAEWYLQTRAAQKFTVIQAVILAEHEFEKPGPSGSLPLQENDPTRPNEAYFAHVDWIVRRANQLGLVVGLLPTWGDKWNLGTGQGPEIFTPENAYFYGHFLGTRYREADIIWILGGDRPVETEEHRAIIRATASGLAEGDGGTHLKLFHPPGGRSASDYFAQDAWLDGDMLQSGHVGIVPNYERITRDYEAVPTRPVLDGEPCYEDHPVMTPQWTPTDEWFGSHAVRRAAYWAVFAGAHGHTYGCHDIWQFLDPARFTPVTAARTPWQTALQFPGANQMRHLRALLESRPFLTRIPDQSLLVSAAGIGTDHVQATRAADGSYAFVYSASGQPFTLDLTKLNGSPLVAWWFDPRTAGAVPVGRVEQEVAVTFTPPSHGADCDWVLVVDDAACGFPPPLRGKRPAGTIAVRVAVLVRTLS